MGETRVLVAAASRHGSTQEIAEAVGRGLSTRGIRADVRRIEDVPESLAAYDAVVLGSAVYMGRWLESARRLVDDRAGELALLPTWLFSSGPVGDPPRPSAETAVDVETILARVSPREHRLLDGKLDGAALSLVHRAVARAVGAADGDYRDWAAVGDWADGIADTLLGADREAASLTARRG